MIPGTAGASAPPPYLAGYAPRRSRRRRSRDWILIVVLVLVLNPFGWLVAANAVRCGAFQGCGVHGGLTPLGVYLGLNYTGLRCASGATPGCQYIFSVLADPGLALSEVRLRLIGATGVVFLRAASTAELVANGTGCDLGRYDFATGSWGAAGGAGCGTGPGIGTFVDGATLVVTAWGGGAVLTGRGLALAAFGTSSLAPGEVVARIP